MISLFRRWFFDPPSDGQVDLLCWALVIGTIWASWPMFWPIWLGAQLIWCLLIGA